MQSWNTKYSTTNPGLCPVSWYPLLLNPLKCQETTSLNWSLRRPLPWWSMTTWLLFLSFANDVFAELGHLVELWIRWHLGLNCCAFCFCFCNFFPLFVFLRLLWGDMVDYKAVVQKHFFGSTSRALLGPLAGFSVEWLEWTASMQRCSSRWLANTGTQTKWSLAGRFGGSTG